MKIKIFFLCFFLYLIFFPYLKGYTKNEKKTNFFQSSLSTYLYHHINLYSTKKQKRPHLTNYVSLYFLFSIKMRFFETNTKDNTRETIYLKSSFSGSLSTKYNNFFKLSPLYIEYAKSPNYLKLGYISIHIPNYHTQTHYLFPEKSLGVSYFLSKPVSFSISLSKILPHLLSPKFKNYMLETSLSYTFSYKKKYRIKPYVQFLLTSDFNTSIPENTYKESISRFPYFITTAISFAYNTYWITFSYILHKLDSPKDSSFFHSLLFTQSEFFFNKKIKMELIHSYSTRSKKFPKNSLISHKLYMYYKPIKNFRIGFSIQFYYPIHNSESKVSPYQNKYSFDYRSYIFASIIVR